MVTGLVGFSSFSTIHVMVSLPHSGSQDRHGTKARNHTLSFTLAVSGITMATIKSVDRLQKAIIVHTYVEFSRSLQSKLDIKEY